MRMVRFCAEEGCAGEVPEGRQLCDSCRERMIRIVRKRLDAVLEEARKVPLNRHATAAHGDKR